MRRVKCPAPGSVPSRAGTQQALAEPLLNIITTSTMTHQRPSTKTLQQHPSGQIHFPYLSALSSSSLCPFALCFLLSVLSSPSIPSLKSASLSQRKGHCKRPQDPILRKEKLNSNFIHWAHLLSTFIKH